MGNVMYQLEFTLHDTYYNTLFSVGLISLYIKYSDWNFHAKLEENTVFYLHLKCYNSYLTTKGLYCHVLEKWLDNQGLEKLIYIWPSLMNV